MLEARRSPERILHRKGRENGEEAETIIFTRFSNHSTVRIELLLISNDFQNSPVWWVISGLFIDEELNVLSKVLIHAEVF